MKPRKLTRQPPPKRSRPKATRTTRDRFFVFQKAEWGERRLAPPFLLSTEPFPVYQKELLWPPSGH